MSVEHEEELREGKHVSAREAHANLERELRERAILFPATVKDGKPPLTEQELMELGFKVVREPNPKDVQGAKKAPLRLIPWGAVVALGPVFANGAAKYGPLNWREHAITRMTYLEAALRHLLADVEGETFDSQAGGSGLRHIDHAIASLLILRDAELNGMAKDDRPPAGKAGGVIAAQTKPGYLTIPMSEITKEAGFWD